MGENDLTLLIMILVILLVGCGLFFFTGFIFNKKDSVFIVERLGKYFGTYSVKAKYFFPLLYRRVGVYKKTSYKEVINIGKNQYYIELKIINFETFHYSGHDISPILEELKNQENKRAYLEEELSKIGIKLINFTKED